MKNVLWTLTHYNGGTSATGGMSKSFGNDVTKPFITVH